MKDKKKLFRWLVIFLGIIIISGIFAFTGLLTLIGDFANTVFYSAIILFIIAFVIYLLRK